MCTYISIINSIVIGSSVLQVRFGYTEVGAGFVFTMPYVIAAVMSPITGLYVDRYGNRMTVIIIGSLFNVIAHVIELLLPDCDQCWESVVPLVMLGISYTTYAVVMWGSLPYMVEARLLGTAFGICTTFQNLGTLVAPPIIGYI
jgi:MFS family permease